MKKICLLVFAIWTLPNFSWGQELQVQSRPLKVGIGMTGNMYVGDLTDSETMFHRVSPGANISLQSEGFRNLKAQLNAGFGRFSEQYDGDPPELPDGIFPVNFVETSFFYGDLRLKYRFLKRKKFQPYVSGGAGFLIFSPQDENGKFLSDAILTRPEGEFYNTAVPQLPLSAGFQARLTSLVWLGAEYTYRYTPTDYLDNIGQLGRRPGNDQLHQLTVSMYFNMAQPDEAIFDPSKKKKEPKIIAQEAEVILPPPPPDKVNRKAITLTTVQLNSSANRSLSSLGKLPGKIALLPVPAETDNTLEIDNWDELAWEAWLDGNVFYYRPNAGDSWEDLEDRFHVKPDILMEINNMEGQELSSQQEIMIPDLREYLKNQPEMAGIIELENSDQVKKEEKAIRAKRFVYYHVKQGDNLQSVALQFQVRPSTIKKLNSLIDNHIYVDSYLRLPELK